MTNDMSDSILLKFYMLIVLNASNTNLHYVYFTTPNILLYVVKERVFKKGPSAFEIRYIVVGFCSSIKLALRKMCRRYTVISAKFLTGDLIFHLQRTLYKQREAVFPLV